MVRRDLSKDRIRFTRVVGKRIYWEPSRKLRALGYGPMNYENNAAGRSAAKKRTAQAEEAIETREKPPTYRAGSLSHFWHHFWRRKQEAVSAGEIRPRTAEEFLTAWKSIEPQLGEKIIDEITPDDVIELARTLNRDATPKVRHRAIKKLRAILDDATRRKIVAVNVAVGVSNPAPKSRSQIWYPSEIATLSSKADEAGMRAMSICIDLMYETARAPVDVRLLNLGAIRKDGSGHYIDRSREKTGQRGFQAISAELHARITSYVSELGIELHPDAPIFRRHKPRKGERNIEPWKDQSEFSKDFSAVRSLAFGKDEKRLAMDIRRTANLEAALGDAAPEERAALLANSVDRDKKLDAVYTPETLRKARNAQAARQKGRDVMRSTLDRQGTL